MIAYQLKMFIVGVILLNTITGCNVKARNAENCRLHYTDALTGLNAYYKSNKTLLLQESLDNVEQSMGCPETRGKSIDMKISLLIHLKRYHSGFEFIDSLGEDDFSAKYKKTMNRDYFQALEYESKSDTNNRNRLLQKIITDVQRYMQTESISKDSLDEEACLSLFEFKKKVYTLPQIDFEIDSLMGKYPNEKDYLNGLKTTIDEKPQFSNALQSI